MFYLSLFAVVVYIIGMLITGGYLAKGRNPDGPDGLIPIFGSVVWPALALIYIIVKPIKCLIRFGTRLKSISSED